MGKTEKRAAAKGAKLDKDDAGPSGRPSQKGLAAWWSFLRRHPSVAILVLVGAPIVIALLWPRTQQVIPIDHSTLAEMTVERFLRHYSAERPVVVSGAWAEEGWRPDELTAACPFARLQTHVFDARGKQWAKHVNLGDMALPDYFASHVAPSFSERPVPVVYGFEMPLKTQCPRQLDKVSVPAFLIEDAFHVVTNGTGLGWPSVLMGPKGSETGLHIDTHRLPFWLAVVGREGSRPGQPLKRVRIYPHDHLRLLKYGKPLENNNFNFDFDPWRPNLRWYPEVADRPVYETELVSGDLLYIPGGSPHAVINLEDNLGVSMNFMDLKTMPKFVKACNKGSPLCNLLMGKGEWVIDALQDRRKQARSMNYFEFAGIRDQDAFCALHEDAKPNHSALVDFCG